MEVHEYPTRRKFLVRIYNDILLRSRTGNRFKRTLNDAEKTTHSDKNCDIYLYITNVSKSL